MYQGARNVYCRYKDIKSVELVYDLNEKPLLFLDLGLVFPGMIIWEDSGSGEAHPLHAGLEFYGERKLAREDVVGREFRVPFGVSFATEPARKGPQISLEGMETQLVGGTMLHDGGTYRLWYPTTEPEGFVSAATKETSSRRGFDLGHLGNVLRYAESDNGVDWRLPQMEHVRLDGAPSNIVYGSMNEPEIGYGGGSVFVDPSAEADSRYKVMFTGRMSPRRQMEFAKATGQQVDPMSLMTGIPPEVAYSQGEAFAAQFEALASGGLPDSPELLPDAGGQVLFGAVSPDGLSWRTLPDPIMLFMAESNNAYYDAEREACVTYIRLWHVAQRRAIGKSVSKDFSRWPFPRALLVPELRDPISTDFYTNAHSLYPGHEDVHLCFVARYRRGGDDCSDISVAISLDGEIFNFPLGGAVISQEAWEWGPTAEPGAGFIIPMTALVPFGMDQMGLVYGGSNVAHKWPRTVEVEHFSRWALWDRERLVGLTAPEHGEFVTAGLILHGPQVFVNARTEMSGRIQAELLDSMGEVLPGYSFEESVPIVGDHNRALLKWRGDTDLARWVGKKIYLRFRMIQAKLYSLTAQASS
ncbi:MAG: hypothetical protein OXO48_18325 [Caldilineaceae bacterium]|nr:hypothetical protein [Caldilineaceae bacterium]MDE0430721.1 hypothetical protein [Caldilineaceae bacterium]